MSGEEPPPRNVGTGETAAFYALRPGGWRDYVTLLHLPYTAWHLSYVIVGGCLAETVSWSRLGLTVLAFFLALGIGAHALDELQGRPLETAIPAAVLVGLASGSVLAAAAIGLAVALSFSLWLLPLIAVGAFLVPAYNLEWFGGRFHNDAWFGVAWGAFPVLTATVACAGAVSAAALFAAAWATVLALAQRALSAQARDVRRRVTRIAGEIEHADGTRLPVTRELMLATPETALRLLTMATVLLAAALAAARL